jgi:hypothetical protein
MSFYLHYKCEVAKLGTAATGNFLLGKRERQGERERASDIEIENLCATLPN